MKNKTTAALLAFFLGGFGAHLFYLGKTGRGFIYLTLAIAALLLYSPSVIVVGIMSFIDFIFIIVMDEHKFNIDYNDGQGNAPQVSTADEIEKLHRLKQNGAITEAEYEAKKKQLLS